MSQAYSLHVLKVAVARICQTIGWHSAHTTPIDLLIDVTQHFLREMCRIMMRYCELYNRTEPNLDDLALAYRDMGINLQELMEYIQFVDPIMLPFEVPRFPVPRESNLNFLKPGSREMMMRPLHIPWYMPPMFPELEEAASAVEGGELANDEEKALVRLDLPPRARAILDVMGASSAEPVEPDATELNLLEGATLSEITIEDTSERVAEPGAVVEDSALLPETAVVNEEVEIPMQTVEVKEPTEDAPPAPSAPTDATVLPPVAARDVAKRPEAPLDKGGDTSKANNQQPSTSEGRPTRNISSVIMTTSGFISPAREGKLPDSRIPIIPEERPPKMLQPPPPPPAISAPHPVSGSAAQGVAASLAASSSGPTLTHPHARDNKHGSANAGGGPLAGGTPFAGGSPATAPSAASLKAGGGGGEKSGKKVKKKPVDRERKKGDKKGSNATPKGEKSSTGSESSSVIGGAQAADGSAGWGAMSAVLPPPQQLEAATAVGSQPQTVATGGPPSFLQPITPADAGSSQFGVFPAPPGQSTTSGVKASSGKAGKEKAVKKRKAPQVHDIALLSTPELFDKLPPPAKQPKVKGSAKRIKQNKKLQALQQQAEGQALFAPHGVPSVATVPPYQTGPDGAQPPPPLIGPWRPGGGSLLGDKFSLPNATPLVPPPELVGKAPPPFGHQGPKQKAASGKQHQGKSDVAASEQAAQLSLLQMMHPSLEITASPSVPERTPPKATGSSKKTGTKAKDAKLQPPPQEVDRDVIVIDDDKSPPRTPSLILPPPSESKKQRKQQTSIGRQPDNLFGAAGHSEYDFTMSSPGANPPLSFRDFSSPEGHGSSGAIPKTPDIKLPMSATSPLLDVDGRKAGRSVPMADAFASDASMAKMPGVGAPSPAAKPKRQKQKAPKADQPGGKQGKQQQQTVDQQQPEPPQFGTGSEQNRNMFPLFPPGPQGLGQYNNYLNQSLQAGMRLGLFPFPSGPGLIPDNPLFPLQPGPYPMGAGNFPLPPNPFALPRMGNLMRMPHPLAGGRRGMGVGGGGGSLNPHHHHHVAFDDNLDPETKLAQTPLDLQKSNCNVAPLVPPSLLQDESLNLSLRLGGSSLLGSATSTATSSSATQPAKQQQEPQPPAPSPATAGMGFLSAQPASTVKQPSKQQESRKEDQVVILPAASVLPGASPPQRSNMCVIDLDGDSDGSQSTTKDDNGRRKVGKEHKKERKVKDGKIKKKKDKKDKSKSKEREREQQLKELTAGTASSSAVLTMGMIGAEEALMEQLRKERKEKKEKRKDKVKKEKRKERERAQQGAGGDTLMVATPPAGADSQPGPAVPKLIMKLSGSGATPSPRSDTPDHHHPTVVATATTADQPKRDGSPELARISALVTRPPKLKPTGAIGGGGSKGKGKDESLLDDDASGFEDVAFPSAGAPAGAKHHSLTTGSVGTADPTTGGNNRSAGTGIMPTIGAGSSSTSAASSSSVKGSSKAARVGAEYGGGKSGVAKLPATIATGSTSSSSSSRKTPKEGSSSKGSKATAVASSTSAGAAAHHHHHHASSSSTLAAVAAPAQMTDVDGNTVWICPACGRVDDGTPMIGCDGCDAWYHWVCVGISVPPDDNEDWYCRVCIGKMQDSHADTEKQRKRKKKDKKTPKD
ncbi:uncharacterized protein LOC131291086 [Anopheles ziemanni]|uniref:uncharacterized protein LOC131269297 n=1 Tax=Anopheles coustani TaxID=139045 RepID=UPI00265B5A58|nr:uncharacterized protein LOC131269297 [Anopheles coustani]XP_058176260.1 uncharacterized protein LOC131291086 [Anopheles ziemanni]